MTKVLVVDDHPVVRLAVRTTLEEAGFDVVAEADNGVDAWLLIQKLVPDVVVLDLGIPRLDGFEVIRRIKKQMLPCQIMVFSASEPDHMVQRCMRAGAAGFMKKDKDITDLVDAVKMIMKGVGYFPSPVLSAEPAYHLSKSEEEIFASLSNRELMVLQQLIAGKSNTHIAGDMLISPKTVSTYKTRVFAKFNVKSLPDLIYIINRNSLL